MAAIVAAIVIGCKMAEGGPFLKMLLSPCVKRFHFFLCRLCSVGRVICWLSNYARYTNKWVYGLESWICTDWLKKTCSEVLSVTPAEVGDIRCIEQLFSLKLASIKECSTVRQVNLKMVKKPLYHAYCRCPASTVTVTCSCQQITLTVSVGSNYASGQWSVCELSQAKLPAMAQGLFCDLISPLVYSAPKNPTCHLEKNLYKPVSFNML